MISPTTVLYPDIYGLHWIYILLSSSCYNRIIYWYNSMFGTKLLGLAISALMTITPFGTGFNNYQNTEIEFPYTRTNTVDWKGTYYVYDLGEESASSQYHSYVIVAHYDLYCSSTCLYGNTGTGTNVYGYNAQNNHIVFELTMTLQGTQAYIAKQKIATKPNPNGHKSESITYADENSYVTMNVTVEHFDGSWGVPVTFPATTQGMVEQNNAYWTEQIYWLTLANALRDTKDIPSSVMQQYTQYINDGDYSQAIEYISNYYQTTNVNNNEETLQVINDYNTHETTLNNYYNTENNFTNQIETDFQNQEQQLPDLDDSIDELQTPSFLSSANWVSQQFNRMTSGNIFGSFLVFSLLTGFIMALIGRFKR